MNDNGGWRNPVSEISNTLRSGKRGPAQAVAFHHTQDPISGDVSPCLSRKVDGMGVAEGMRVRRLTPLECERLQGFPDNYTLIPGYRSDRTGEFGGNKGAADGPRYRAIGNSMAVPVMHWIGRRIDFVDRLILAAEAA